MLAAKAVQPIRKRAQIAPKKKPKRSAAAVIKQSTAAANAALNAFTKELLANHIKTCVADDIRAGNDEVIDELVTTLQKLMR